jgi:hypothetical protein
VTSPPIAIDRAQRHAARMKNLASNVTRLEIAIPAAIVVLLALPRSSDSIATCAATPVGSGIALAMTLRPRD